MYFLHLIAAVAVASASLVARDVPLQPYIEIKTVDSDCNKFTSACQSSNGSVSSIQSLNSSFSQIDQDCQKLLSDVQASGSFSSSDAQTDINYLNNTFEPDLKKTLTCLDSKRAAYQSAGLYTTEQSTVNHFRTCLRNLGSATISKSPAAQQSAAKAVFSKIDADFDANGGF